MGTVYRATHIALDHLVALKVIAADLADDDSFRERFKSESRIAVSLRHPNVVPIHHAGEEDGLLFVTMDLIDGPDLRKLLLAHGSLDGPHAVAILEQVASALDVAHSRGLVHRDIKPGNILIEQRAVDEHAYLTDFGLTKRMDQAADATALTSTGAFVGTLDYVAPEQIRGEELDARTDVYALGCVLYEMVAGEAPFASREEKVAKMYAHLQDEPAWLPGDSEAAGSLDGVIARAMAKGREGRYPSAGDLARAAAAAVAGGAVAEEERSVATGPAAPTAAYVVPGAIDEPIDPTVESEVPPAPDPDTDSEPTRRYATGGEAVAEPAPEGEPPSPAGRDPRAARRRVTTSIAVVAVAAVVAVVLVSSSGDGQDSGAGGTAPSSADPAAAPLGPGAAGKPLEIAGTPVGIAYGAEPLVVTRGTGQIVPVDGVKRTGEPVQLDGVASAEDVIAGTNALWVTAPESNAVVRIEGGNPDGAQTLVQVGDDPKSLAEDAEGNVWVSNFADNTVSRIPQGAAVADPAIALQDGASGPHGIAADGGYIWVTARDTDQVVRIDRADPANQKLVKVGDNPKGIAVAEGKVWVANTESGSVSVINAESAKREQTVKGLGVPRDVILAEDLVWVSDGDGAVHTLDPADPAGEAGTVKIPGSGEGGPEELAAGDGLIWVTTGLSNAVVPIDPAPSS